MRSKEFSDGIKDTSATLRLLDRETLDERGFGDLTELKRLKSGKGGSLKTATAISLQRQTRCLADSVGAGDGVDYFRFRMRSTTQLKLKILDIGGDAEMTLLNSHGRAIATPTQSDGVGTIRRNLTAGTYYIRVTADTPTTAFYLLSAKTAALRGNAARIVKEDSNQHHVIADWNAVALDAIRTAKTAPPVAARALAVVHTAVYDAVNSILKFGKAYEVSLKAPKEVSVEAAAVGAAYQALNKLFNSAATPNAALKTKFDAALASSLAEISRNAKAEANGIAFGKKVADRIIALRATDGSNVVVNYTPLQGDGYWQPTPTANAPALLPQWANVNPFALQSGSQFRPSGNPAYNSPQYLQELDYVRRIGSKTSTERTAEQTQIALFWADGPGTFTPPGHCNQIAADVARTQGNSLFEDARLFALLNISLADAGIAAWDAKYTYNQWRPVTAIRATTTDKAWQPLIATPPFPDYISGHSAFSGAASSVLTAFFGRNVRFSVTGDPSLNLGTRTYSSFEQAAMEAGISRVYGGIHVMSSNKDGLATGVKVGKYVVKKFLIV